MIKTNVGKDVERPDPSHDAGRNLKMDQLENNVAIPLKEKKTKHEATIWPSNDTPWYLSQRNKNLTFRQKQVNGRKKKETYTGMLIISLSVKAPNWK